MYFYENHAIADKDYFSFGNLSEPFPAHMHRAFELICVREGSLNLQIDQKEYILNIGELAIVFPNQIHGFFSDCQFNLSILIFSPELITEFYQAYKDFVPVNSVIKMPLWLDFAELKCIYSKMGALYLLCGLLLSDTEIEAASSHANKTVLQKVFSYISHHYAENCSLKYVAEALNYDYSYLSRLFSKYTGIGFTEYLNNYRIFRACSMLEKNELTISEIAFHSGYTSLRTFHRNFRKVMHCSPQNYISSKVITS